jgi:hypothetical protein
MAKNKIDFSLDNPENAAVAETKEVIASASADEDEPLEVAVGPEEEAKPEVVTMTPEEFAALKASGDSAKAVREGIESLSAKLGSAPPPQQQVLNAPQETPEEFFQKNADDIFDHEKGAAVLRKYTKMVGEQEFGGVITNLSTSLQATKKELLEARDANYRKYKGEVETLVNQQPPNVRANPDIYEQAWNVVRQKHSSEIEAENVKSQVDKAVEQALRERGIDPSKKGDMRPAAHVNSEGRSTPQAPGASRGKVRLPDEATKNKLMAEAKKKGMDLEDLLRLRGYMQ